MLLLFLLGICGGCANRNTGMGVAPPTPGSPVSLGRDVQPIFTVSCATAFCHGSPLGAPMSLLPADSHSSLVGVASCEAPMLMRVEPGNSATSYLMIKLAGTQSTVLGGGGCGSCVISGVTVGDCGARMPLTGPPYLPDAEIQLIGEWIDQGAADN